MEFRNSTDGSGPAHLFHLQLCFLYSHLPSLCLYSNLESAHLLILFLSHSDIPKPGFALPQTPTQVFLWLGSPFFSSATHLPQVSLANFYMLLLCSQRLKPVFSRKHIWWTIRAVSPSWSHLHAGKESKFRTESLSCYLVMEKKKRTSFIDSF